MPRAKSEKAGAAAKPKKPTPAMLGMLGKLYYSDGVGYYSDPCVVRVVAVSAARAYVVDVSLDYVRAPPLSPRRLATASAYERESVGHLVGYQLKPGTVHDLRTPDDEVVKYRNRWVLKSMAKDNLFGYAEQAMVREGPDYIYLDYRTYEDSPYRALFELSPAQTRFSYTEK